MKFSIIIPVFNTQEFITQCIHNILSQKSNKYELELLVIDDCSTDNSFNIIKELSEKIWKLYH